MTPDYAKIPSPRKSSRSHELSLLLEKSWPLLLVVAIVAFLRFFRLLDPIWRYGIDEGVELMAARMWRNGYAMYSTINSVQAPLFV